MIVYRVELIDNPRYGPWRMNPDRTMCAAFRAGLVAQRLGVIDPSDHPEPCDEGLDLRPDLVCGMPSLDAYRTWFAHEQVRAELYAHGDYHMRVYDVPDHLVQRGMLQVCFNPDDATSVRVATKEEMA